MAVPQSHPNYDPIIHAKYSAAIMEPLKKTWAFAQPGVTNQEFDGLIKGKGDTVKVSTMGDPTVKKYDESKDMEIEDLTFGDDSMVIDQGDYVNFRVPFVSQYQDEIPVKDPAIARAAENMSEIVDTYVGGLMKNGAHNANKLGTVDLDPEKKDAYRLLVGLRAKLNAQHVPKDNRFVMVGPEFESALLFDDRLDKIDSGQNMLNGEIGRLLGFRIISAPTIPNVASREMVIAGHSMATTFGYQITGTWESSELPRRIASVVTMLQVYGGKVFRPEALATADINILDGSTSEPPVGG